MSPPLQTREVPVGSTRDRLAVASDRSRNDPSASTNLATVPTPRPLPSSRATWQVANASGIRSQPTAGSQGRWYRAGESVSIAGITIYGMVYVGRRLPSQRTGSPENCLIDPTQPVSSVRADRAGETMPYWLSYSQITPEARRAYLTWLANGRRDPAVGIGHVFLFFYGLERRLFVDSAFEETQDLIREVEALLAVYGDNRSFNQYARRFLDVAMVVDGMGARLELPPPLVPERQGEVPLLVRVGIGWRIHEGHPIAPNWMLAWLLSDPETTLRSAAKRAFPEFVLLFRKRFEEKHPGGMKIDPPRRKLQYRYEAASRSFSARVEGILNEWPDISTLRKPLSAAREIADSCTDALDAYSRYLAKDPNGREKLNAVRLLPPDIAQEVGNRSLEELKRWLSTVAPTGSSALAAHELFSRTGVLEEGQSKVGRATFVAVCELLDPCGYGIEPDPRYGGHTPKGGDPIVLFRADGGATIDVTCQAYASAVTLLTLGAVLIHADDEVTQAEERHLLTHLETALHFNEAERKRLEARLLLLMRAPPRLSALKGRFEDMAPDQRRQVARFAIAVAAADGHVAPSEIKLLERTYGLLDLDRTTLFSDIHALSILADEPIAVRSADPQSGGVPIPKSSSRESGPIALDLERLRRIREETTQVSGLLAEIFVEEQESRPEISTAHPEPSDPVGKGKFDGLDDHHSRLLRAAVERVSLPRSEFDALARQEGLLPDGAIETINDWALDRFDDMLIEDGNEVTVAAHYLNSREGDEHDQRGDGHQAA